MSTNAAFDEIAAALDEAYQSLQQVEPGSDALPDLYKRIAQIEEQMIAWSHAATPPMDEQVLRRLAFPRWFTREMLEILLPQVQGRYDLVQAFIDRGTVVNAMQPFPAYALSERERRRFVATADEESWEQTAQSNPPPLYWDVPANHDERTEFTAALADFYGREADSPRWKQSEGQECSRQPWQSEYLYHEIARNVDAAMTRLREWLQEAIDIEERFDLATAYRLLVPFNDRRDLIASLDSAPALTAQLDQYLQYLQARSTWADAWYKTIPYLEVADLTTQLDQFFGDFGAGGIWAQVTPATTAQPTRATPPSETWLALIQAEGGFGKTALIEWLLSRYALPKGYICAHFDFDSLNQAELLEAANSPENIILRKLVENFATQRGERGMQTGFWELAQEQLSRGSSFSDHLAALLCEQYAGRTILLLIDTIEVLIERAPDFGSIPGHSSPTLERLLNALDLRQSYAWTSNVSLRVVLAGRTDLTALYPHSFTNLGVTPLKVSVLGFDRIEAEDYLREKRRLTDNEMIAAILDTATEKTGKIVPFKLALYADTVQAAPDETPKSIREHDIDILYFVRRILNRIDKDHLDLHWLMRYGVIFRTFNEEAAHLVLRFVEAARQGGTVLDDLDDDPIVRDALAKSRDLSSAYPLDTLTNLLAKLGRYSWTSYRPPNLVFHELVRKPQLAIVVERKKLFKALHQTAHDYYRDKAARAPDDEGRAAALKEAIFHGFYLGHNGLRYWHSQMERYAQGPATVLAALVTEALEPPARDMPPDPVRSHGMYSPTGDFAATEAEVSTEPERAHGMLSPTARYNAWLSLAHVRCQEHGRAQSATQQEREAKKEDLAQAKRALETATELATTRRRQFHCGLVRARLALAQRTTGAAREAVEALQRLPAPREQQVEQLLLHHLKGDLARASGDTEEAILHLRLALKCLRAAKKPLRTVPFAPADQLEEEITLSLVEILLNGTQWRDAFDLHAKLRQRHGESPALLRSEARLAFRRAQFQLAYSLYEQAIVASTHPADKRQWQQEQRLTAFYRGDSLQAEPDDSLELKLALAAAHARWDDMQTILHEAREAANKAHIQGLESEILEILNLQLQFNLEITRDWHLNGQLMDTGEKLVKELTEKRGPSDPALARFEVARQYRDYFTSAIKLDPTNAEAERATRFAQIENLRTPEARVRAKAYLLLARYFAKVATFSNTMSPGVDQQAALDIYLAGTREALQKGVKLLVKLPPFTQVDLLRTLACLPGWSSALVNSVGLDPTERDPSYLLARELRADDSATQPPFLAPFATDLYKSLKPLIRDYISPARTEWPLLQSSLLRVLASLGRSKEVATIMNTLPDGGNQGSSPILLAYDLIAAQGANFQPERVEALAQRLKAERESGLLKVLWLNSAALALQARKGNAAHVLHWTAAALNTESNVPSVTKYHAYVLRVVARIQQDNLQLALDSLNLASEIRVKLGSPLQLPLETLPSPSTPPPQVTREFVSQLGASLQVWEYARALAENFFETLSQGKESATLSKYLRDTIKNGLNWIYTLSRDPSSTRDSPTEALPEGGTPLRFMISDQLNGLRVSLGPENGTHASFAPLLEKIPANGSAALDTDRWHQLLHQPLEATGAALLDSILPPGSSQREALKRYLDAAPHQPESALRIHAYDATLDVVPWELMYLSERKQWLVDLLPFSRGEPRWEDQPLPGPETYQGAILGVMSYDGTRKSMRVRKARQMPIIAAWNPEPLPTRVGLVVASYPGIYGAGLLFQTLESNLMNKASVEGIEQPTMPPLRMLYLLGNFQELSREQGVTLHFVENKYRSSTDRLTPDALYHALRQLGITNILLLLEALPSDSITEDARRLLLRNRFAAALSRLGGWTIVALGPEQDSTTPTQNDRIVKKLVECETLMGIAVEEIIRDESDFKRAPAATAIFYPGGR